MATNRKTGLGRGFDELFSDTDRVREEVRIEPERGEPSQGISYLDINEIKPNATQPRKVFDEEKIRELSDSIQKHGLIQPIMVRPAKVGYEIVAGERRWRAARHANLKQIPAIIKELDEEQNMFIALIENIHRENLNPIEEARAYGEMAENYHMTQEQISESVGKSRPYITNALRLLKLSPVVQDFLMINKLTQGHGKVLAGISDENKQIKLAKEAVSKGLSVRDLEKIADEEKKPGEKKKAPLKKNREIAAAEEELRNALGTKVTIKQDGKKGIIAIEYYSREELDRLYELLTGIGNE